MKPIRLIMILAALAATTTAVAQEAEECNFNTGVCLGVDWKTVTPAGVADIDVRSTQVIFQSKLIQGQTVRTTPLHWAAAYSENPAVAAALLDKGADVNGKDYGDNIPLHWAAGKNKNPAIITLLINAGADIHAKNNWGGQTPLHQAAENNENPAVVQALLDVGADIEATMQGGSTPIHRAAYNKSLALWPVLFKAGADINVWDNTQRTPLHFAATYNKKNPTVIAFMLAAGAKVNAKDTNANGGGVPPLFYAVIGNKPIVMAILIEAGATVKPDLTEVAKESPAQKDKDAAIAVLERRKAADEIFAQARQIMREAAALWNVGRSD